MKKDRNKHFMALSESKKRRRLNITRTCINDSHRDSNQSIQDDESGSRQYDELQDSIMSNEEVKRDGGQE